MPLPVVTLPAVWVVAIDAAAWTFFHLSISFICMRLPLSFFLKEHAWSRIYPWERSGALWQRLFKVKYWKGRIIDGTIFLKRGYSKKRLPGKQLEELKRFAAETKRAELTHWLSILPAPLFFLWNPFWAGWAMVAYAVLFNFPIIIAQRYNRGRLTAIIASERRR
ncbi:glycosyl-4,4'-diaponeurosporenoate acyltransferase [Indiicoccus explosivorum]|uniref:glycosyl-4,4'-diaponeurosporenoate acyltransferase CrtO family protein n=1 Tax=Indiicoccus explosivorum TaxID=1917864 RepID=UPI000B452800|nr:glycosyl-4,4'-diaponeurosporenoate acyltransferase [Indiicoccus explosivorum]